MIHNNDSWLRSFILQYLEQIEYWHVRFELSRDIEHLDNAERFADAESDTVYHSFRSTMTTGLEIGSLIAGGYGAVKGIMAFNKLAKAPAPPRG